MKLNKVFSYKSQNIKMRGLILKLQLNLIQLNHFPPTQINTSKMAEKQQSQFNGKDIYPSIITLCIRDFITSQSNNQTWIGRPLTLDWCPPLLDKLMKDKHQSKEMYKFYFVYLYYGDNSKSKDQLKQGRRTQEHRQVTYYIQENRQKEQMDGETSIKNQKQFMRQKILKRIQNETLLSSPLLNKISNQQTRQKIKRQLIRFKNVLLENNIMKAKKRGFSYKKKRDFSHFWQESTQSKCNELFLQQKGSQNFQLINPEWENQDKVKEWKQFSDFNDYLQKSYESKANETILIQKQDKRNMQTTTENQAQSFPNPQQTKEQKNPQLQVNDSLDILGAFEEQNYNSQKKEILFQKKQEVGSLFNQLRSFNTSETQNVQQQSQNAYIQDFSKYVRSLDQIAFPDNFFNEQQEKPNSLIDSLRKKPKLNQAFELELELFYSDYQVQSHGDNDWRERDNDQYKFI